MAVDYGASQRALAHAYGNYVDTMGRKAADDRRKERTKQANTPWKNVVSMGAQGLAIYAGQGWAAPLVDKALRGDQSEEGIANTFSKVGPMAYGVAAANKKQTISNAMAKHKLNMDNKGKILDALPAGDEKDKLALSMLTDQSNFTTNLGEYQKKGIGDYIFGEKTVPFDVDPYAGPQTVKGKDPVQADELERVRSIREDARRNTTKMRPAGYMHAEDFYEVPASNVKPEIASANSIKPGDIYGTGEEDPSRWTADNVRNLTPSDYSALQIQQPAVTMVAGPHSYLGPQVKEKEKRGFLGDLDPYYYGLGSHHQ